MGISDTTKLELVDNAPAYRFFPTTKNYLILKACVIPYGLRKGKTGNWNQNLQKLKLLCFH